MNMSSAQGKGGKRGGKGILFLLDGKGESGCRDVARGDLTAQGTSSRDPGGSSKPIRERRVAEGEGEN